jgi:hypothetical protein
MALLGEADQNRFLDSQYKWRVPIVPTLIRLYPFTLLETSADQSNRLALALDRDAPHFSETDGTPLITPEGKPTALINQVFSALVQCQNDISFISKLLAEFNEHDVLIPSGSFFRERFGVVPRIADALRIVDVKRVDELDQAVLERWKKSGMIKLIHLHLGSLEHVKHWFCSME